MNFGLIKETVTSLVDAEVLDKSEVDHWQNKYRKYRRSGGLHPGEHPWTAHPWNQGAAYEDAFMKSDVNSSDGKDLIDYRAMSFGDEGGDEEMDDY